MFRQFTLVLLCGCLNTLELDEDAGSREDADSRRDSERDSGREDARPPTGCPPRASAVDILLMVDNSHSMSEEQSSLAEELSSITLRLSDRGLDLRVGVISSDLGVGGNPVFTCEGQRLGDDAVLTTSRTVLTDECGALSHPPFIDFRGGDPRDRDAFGDDAACMALLGTHGCGFEQPLDAVLKALTPSTSELQFASDTSGHADGANAGFLRADAALAILLLTDEDDCSALDPDVFNERSTRYPGENLNLRCWEYPEAVHPISRYVEGLTALKDDPRRIAFIPVVGVPVDRADSSYESILADPRLAEVPDPEARSQLTPSCDVPGRGVAFPPRRILSVAAGLRDRGAQTDLFSICQENFGLETGAIERAAGYCD